MKTIPDKWLITGGCGFLGTSLIAHLLKTCPDIYIRVFDNLSVGTRDDLAEICSFVEANPDRASGTEGVELVVGDIKDYKSCVDVSRDIDVIVHFAASTGVPISVENPRMDMENNVIGTFSMLEAARQNGVERFIFASSGAPLGEVEPPVNEKIAPKPFSPYGASKLAGEGYCSAYHGAYGLKTVALRFGNVYGPRAKNKDSVISKFFKLAFEGKPLEIYGDGEQTRDFIYIDDLIRAVILSSEADVGGEVFQIATHKETTINEIAVMIKNIVESETGSKVEVVYGGKRLGDIVRNYSDISKAKAILGYDPKFDLDMGLRATFDYFEKIC
jgi:UDP-glucose 4-epimerase